jgi:DNA invertase Pin-like site-specific DNA recombinase
MTKSKARATSLVPHAPETAPVVPARLPVVSLASVKVQPQHLERLAVVYIRQSSPRQVQENRESTARQYALVDYAMALGWSRERTLVIDADQGQSSQQRIEDRPGFQRILTEVTMDHVGIVFGLEMSRLARSDKDWHQLLEVCGVFRTLLADQDGVYDAADPNDRLLLGLKGTISAVELHTLRNRLEKGRLSKAQRGELFLDVPTGYVKLSRDEVGLDPDEQVRSVVALVFAKFNELGTGRKVLRYLLRNDICLGIRAHDGPNRGQVEWRRPCVGTIYGMLHNPIYAGTYAYGRGPVDPKRKLAGRRSRSRKLVPASQWKVVRHGDLPAYITWEQYLQNQERLRQNRSRWDTPGTVRPGAGLLCGLVFCAKCGTRLRVNYKVPWSARYDCVRHHTHCLERTCHGIRAATLDALVTQQVLRALEPAALELSIQASGEVQRERDRLALHWKQQLERARHEAHKAERHYRAVDPENRLVARSLEQQWEQALRQIRQLEEEYDRFLQHTPPQVTAKERERIRALAADIPALWASPATTTADRKEIIRAVIERVQVRVQGNTEMVDVTIHWAGTFVSQHQIVRPVAGYRQLRDMDRLVHRLGELRDLGLKAREIAARLNQEGFRPAGSRRSVFNNTMVYQLLSRWGLCGERNEEVELGPDEWWLSDLARKLGVCMTLLRRWACRGWAHYRRTPRRRCYILWADGKELDRLGQMRDYANAHPNSQYPQEITVPKKRLTGR